MDEEIKLPIKIDLNEPIDTGEDGKPPITCIVINRKPKGSDWVDFPIGTETTAKDYLKVLANISGIPFPIIKKIDTQSMVKAINIVTGFLFQGS